MLRLVLALPTAAIMVGCAANVTSHPRLFFSAGDVPALRQRARTTHHHYVQIARAVFDADMKANPALPQAPTSWDNWPIEPWTARMINATMLYAATGDRAVFEQTRQWLLGLCSLRAAANNNYTYGHYALALAAAYDVLHDDLSDADRRTVREHLAAVCQGLASGGWWGKLYLHHDCWIPTAGLGVAALALKDEDDRWRGWYESARDQLALSLSMLGGDGGWPEGPSGWTYGMAAFLPFAEAARNVAGDDLYAKSAWLRNTAVARLYLRLPDGGYFNYGDAHRDGRYGGTGSTPAHLLRLLAARFRDGHAQWLAEREEAADGNLFEKALRPRGAPSPSLAPSTLTPAPLPKGEGYAAPLPQNANCWFYSAGWGLLWFDPSVKAVPPDGLPPQKVFDDLGYVVARTGWGGDANVMTFRAGPMVGEPARRAAERRGHDFAYRVVDSAEHAHQDQNALTFFAAGRYWLSPRGYGARSSARHNTLLINGRQQIKDTLAAGVLLRREFADDYVYLLGDASSVYPPEADVLRFHRHVLWLKPDVLVICDDVRLKAPHEVQWRLHPEPGKRFAPPTTQPGRLAFRAVGESAGGIDIRFLLPDLAQLAGPTTQPTDEELRNRKTLGYVQRMAYCQASATGDRLTFLVVIAPPSMSVERLPVEGGVGIAVSSDGRQRAAAFFLEPMAAADDVKLAGESPADVPLLVVGLPAEVGVTATRTAGHGALAKPGTPGSGGGAVSAFSVSPGRGAVTSAEGTLRLR